VSATLRFGIIVDRPSAPRWQAAVVDALHAGGDAELALVIEGADPQAPARSRMALWSIYNNGWVARRARALAPAGTWRALAPEVATIRAEVTRKGRWSQYFDDQTMGAIRAYDLDFIVRFGLGIIRGEILDVARLGIWSFHHDDERVIRGGPPSFWELYDGMSTSGVVLQRLTDRLDGGIPLARARFSSVLHSYPRNRDRVLLGAADMPARVARAVRRGLLDVDALSVSPSDAPIRHNPTNREMLTFLARQSRRAFTVRARGVVKADVWTVGIADAGDVTRAKPTIGAVHWIAEQIESGYLADPFPARRDGRFAILVEEFDEASNQGTISVLEQEGDSWKLHSRVLDPGVHASYPFLIEHHGELYCTPETSEANRLEIWRCSTFPTGWERAGVLVDSAPIVDPTIFEYEGRWWLLATLKNDEPDAKLHAWTADDLLGPWSPHPLNPIKIDVTSSRPAGTPYIVDGVLYRPAQDCSVAYGSAIVINRVVSLGAAGIVEGPITRIGDGSGRYSSGIHTLALRDQVCAVDGRRYTVNRHRAAREVKGRLRALARSIRPTA
jgi:hypothetical protein